MGIISGERIGAGMRSSISDSAGHGESYPSNSAHSAAFSALARGRLFPNSSPSNFQSHEMLEPHSVTNYENETSMEEMTEEWICLHLDPGSSPSKPFQEESLIEDHDESSLGGSPPSPPGLNGTTGYGGFNCNRSWDGILCWPETPEGSSATLSCFSQLNGIPYDTSRKLPS